MNPLIPSPFDVLLSAVTLVAFVLAVAAIVSLWRKGVSEERSFWKWALIIVLIPVAGAIAWFLRAPKVDPGPSASGGQARA